MRWQKRLNKTQLQHVREFCGGTLSSFKGNRLDQIERNIAYGPLRDNEDPGYYARNDLCFECRTISNLLGVEIELQEKALEDLRAGRLDK